MEQGNREMRRSRFIKTVIGVFLAVFVTLGTAGGWEYPQKDATPHKKAASKVDAKKKKQAGEEQEHSGAQVKEAHGATGAHEVITVAPEEAYQKLMDGNRQYVAGKLSTAHSTGSRRAETAKGQHPFAIILSCSDSRVPPEIIFNQGIGDLFVVRTAGHVAGDPAIGSIEYAVEHLGVRLIMVLGHERCGAVDATIKGGAAPGHIAGIVEAINPAVEKAREKQGDLMDNAVKANAKMWAQKLSTSKPILSELFEDGVLKIVGGVYDLDTGAVTLTYNPK